MQGLILLNREGFFVKAVMTCSKACGVWLVAHGKPVCMGSWQDWV